MSKKRKSSKKKSPINPVLQQLADVFGQVESAFGEGRQLILDMGAALEIASETDTAKLLQTFGDALAMIQSQVDEFLVFCNQVTESVGMVEDPSLEKAFDLALAQQKFILEQQLSVAETAGGIC
ncbi:MAG: hypothetical protein ACLQO6_12695 [Desulfomonilaceae bacterium]